MKKLLLAAVLAVTAASGAVAQNIRIPLGDTGYFGQIDMGNLGRPPVIYQEPQIVQRVPNYERLEPTYMRVPPGHAKKWSKHCAKYNACNRPVYFVQDSWYNDTYAPRYREMHRGDNDYDKERAKDRREHIKEEQKDRREFLKERAKDRKEHYKEHKKDHKNDHKKGHGQGHGNGKH